MSTSFWKIQLFYFVWRTAVVSFGEMHLCCLLHLENMLVCFTSVWGNVPVLFYSILGNMPVCFTSFWETTPVFIFYFCWTFGANPPVLHHLWQILTKWRLNLKFGNLRYLHVSNLQVLLIILRLTGCLDHVSAQKNVAVTYVAEAILRKSALKFSLCIE